VAMCRALESERVDAIFDDPYARRLAGERGATIIDALPQGRSMAWPVVARTAVMDEIIIQCVRQGASTVLNLGAGLDARAFRLALPTTLEWIDVDLPDLIAMRNGLLSDAVPTCVHRSLAADLSDAAVLADVLALARGPALVITEGLLTYFTQDQVVALAQAIHAAPGARWWLTDLMSPHLLRMLEQSWHAQLAAANAPMRFAPPDGAAFFELFGWRASELRSVWEESVRLRRSTVAPGLPKAMQDGYRRMASVVLLERG
jgi:methyltransferase (TIGR00027 family)